MPPIPYARQSVYQPNRTIGALLLRKGDSQADAWRHFTSTLAGSIGELLDKPRRDAELRDEQEMRRLQRERVEAGIAADRSALQSQEMGRQETAKQARQRDQMAVLMSMGLQPEALEREIGVVAGPQAAAEMAEQRMRREKLGVDMDVSRAELEQARTPKPRTINTDRGIFDFSTGQIIPGTEPPEKEYEVTVPGPRGPVTRLVKASDLRRGVQEYRAPSPRASEPLETVVGPDGTPILVPRSQAVGKTPASGTARPASGVEKRALTFFNRAQQADVDIEAIEDQIQQLDTAGQARLAYAPNWAQSDLGQSYRQAQRAFTEARLRKDSGAAIPEHEYENDRKTYFADVGDSPANLAQKRRARAAVLASLGFESGQALGEFVGDAEEARRVVAAYKARADKANAGQKAATPKVGERRRINGRVGEWDGSGWVEVP